MKATLKKITPELATELLKRGGNNRTVNKKRVRFLSDQMKRGLWTMNGQTLVLAKTGELLDGQHRLHAVIDSGVPIMTLVVDDVDRSVMPSIDTGKSRTLSDVYRINEIKNYAAISSLVREIHRHRRSRKYKTGSAEMFLSNEDGLRMYHELNMNDDLQDAVKNGRNAYESMGGLINVVPLAFTYYLTSKIDVELAKLFLTILRDPFNLNQYHPIRAIRDRWVLHRNAVRRTDKLTSVETTYGLIFAWNRWVNRKQLRRMHIDGILDPEVPTDGFMAKIHLNGHAK